MHLNHLIAGMAFFLTARTVGNFAGILPEISWRVHARMA